MKLKYKYILMIEQFIDRKDELVFLEKHEKSNDAEFVVLYGRRRVGKTELIQKFLLNKKYIYFLGREESKEDFWSRLNLHLAKHFDDFSLIERPLKKFEFIFEYLCEKAKNERVIIVFDEFPIIFDKFPEVISILQEYWDNHLKDSKIFLIVCGSSIRMMENKVLSFKSPLYGRRTGQWRLMPIPVSYLKDMFPGYSTEEIIKVYAVLDAIPGYLVKFNKDRDLSENIKSEILSKGEFLYEEVENLLREEFRDISNYMSIIKCIAGGYTTFGEIHTNTNLDKSLISKYLFILENLHIIKKEFPVTTKYKKLLKGKGNYILYDNFFNFWFKFVYLNKENLERGEVETVFRTIEEDFNTYLGFVFEKACKEFLIENAGKLPFKFTRIGRQWGKMLKAKQTYEIDLVALNEETKDTGFFEVKWKVLEEKQALRILWELKEKSRHVDWNLGSRKEHFGLIAKKIENKAGLIKQGYLVFDLADF